MKDKIEDISDSEELFIALTKRKHWNRIPRDILKLIFENAELPQVFEESHEGLKKVEKIDRLLRFIVVSEDYHCIEKNFIPIVNDSPGPKAVLALFSVTLERLAAKLVQTMYQIIEKSEEQETKSLTVSALAAYKSSILCNPFMLPSYAGLASFYGLLGLKELVIKTYQSYNIAEKKLLSIDDSKLSYYDRATKENIPTYREMVDSLKAELRIL